MRLRIADDPINVPPDETKHRFERHWQTQRLIDAFTAMGVNEWASKEDLAARCDISVESFDKRYRSAYLSAERDHHVIVRPERRDKLSGFRRFDQSDADVPTRKYLNGARNKAKRATSVIKYGVTDFDKIEASKRKELFALQAQAAVISRASGARTTRALVAATSNEKLDIGRTLEFLKK